MSSFSSSNKAISHFHALTSVYKSGGESMSDRTMPDVREFSLLLQNPSIRTVRVEGQLYIGPDYPKCSSLEHLMMRSAKIPEFKWIELLAPMRRLQTLDICAGSVGGDTIGVFSVSDFGRGLLQVKDTLVTLRVTPFMTLSSTWDILLGSLASFTKLKTLSIQARALIGDTRFPASMDLWTQL